MIISLLRALLEDLAHGPGPVCGSVRCDDPGQHLPGGLRLQERQVRSQTQVRRTNTPRQQIGGSVPLLSRAETEVFVRKYENVTTQSVLRV